MKLARDGIQLSFDVAGMGSPQFLFVHGLGGDRTHFAPQMEYFTRQGRTLNAELRGHGASDKPKQEYSIEGFAEDLVWLCARQQITQPVIVGQSMGGNMALEIAARYPDFPAGLVLLDSGVLSLPRQGRYSPSIWRAYAARILRIRCARSWLTPVCRQTDAAPMLNRPFWRRHST
jgi:pimeloyl-ACP methyl ester carboxylesterase